MLVMGATNRLPSQRLQRPFSADVANMALDLSGSVVAGRMQPRLRNYLENLIDGRTRPVWLGRIESCAFA
jgi:hypothetical protein